MLLIILALVWVAILSPIAIRYFRDHGTERSIQSFHQEHEVLSRQEYTVAPAHRLDLADVGYEQLLPEPASRSSRQRPRLTVVHPDDTFRSLETRTSWDEWSEDYDFDRDLAPATSRVPEHSANRYASAYASTPSPETVVPVRRRSMRVRRRVVFTRIALAAVVLTALYFAIGYSVIEDLAILAWVGVVGFVALALYAVSQGYLDESSLPIHLPSRRRLAPVEPLYAEAPEEFDSEFYEPGAEVQWRRESPSRYALG